MRYRSLAARHGVDAFVVALALAAQVELWLDPRTPQGLAAAAAVFWTLPLLARRRHPLAAPVIVFATIAVESFLPGEAVVQSQASIVAVLASFWIAGTHLDLRAALAGAAAGYAAIASVFLNDFTDTASVFLMCVISASAWGLGRAFAARARRADELELRAARLERDQHSAIAEERARIARELHDVIAHSVSVMTVQAGAARLLLEEDPKRAREPLLSVEDTGRQVLADMRRLLGVLRDGDERVDLAPQPGMDDVTALVDQVRTAGLDAEVVVEGERRPLPPAVDLTAYRIVQEALTNAIKHADPPRANIAIRYDRELLELEVRNDGRFVPQGQAGHGLVGMRERVALYGGTFYAGPDTDGGFTVRARLPLAARER